MKSIRENLKVQIKSSDMNIPEKGVEKIMHRIVIYGVTLPKNKILFLALRTLYGIGIISAKKICRELGLSSKTYIDDLTTEQQFLLIRKIKQNFRIENNLKETIKTNIQILMENGSYRGFRHRNKLPVRGQRTHTNGKTIKRLLRISPSIKSFKK